MSIRLDVRVTEELYNNVSLLANNNNITVTNIVKAFVLKCARTNELPFSITEIPTFKGVSIARLNTRFDESLEEDILKFKEICAKNYIPVTTAIKTYLYLCCKKNEVLIKPDFASGDFCERSFHYFKDKGEKYEKIAVYRENRKDKKI